MASTKSLVFNRANDTYIFTGRQFRANNKNNLLSLTSADFSNNDPVYNAQNKKTSIDISNDGYLSITSEQLQYADGKLTIGDSNSTGETGLTILNRNVDISGGSLYVSSDVSINGTLDVTSDTNLFSTLTVHDDLTVDSGNLRVASGNLIIGISGEPNEIGGVIRGVQAGVISIDPNPYGSAGTVIIEGDLQVTGTTTTINSSVVDVSDLAINLAYDVNTSTAANNAGIVVGPSNEAIASFTYLAANNEWATNIGLDISGDLDVSGDLTVDNDIKFGGDLLPLSASAKIPVTYSTLAVKTDSTVLSDVLTISGEQDISATNYDISMILMSASSAVRIEFKVNFVTSGEADQLITFIVKDLNNSGNVVFTDSSMGTLMGTGNLGVYNGTYIDTPGHNNPHYQLYFNVSLGKDEYGNKYSELQNETGILGGNTHSNYIYMQELYKPPE